MIKIKHLFYLHLCVLLFSMTEVFGKMAANEYNANGIYSIKVYLYIGMMLVVCLLYAYSWQKIIRHFDLHIAYANRSMYLVWSQIWAVCLFSESLTPRNIIGMLIVMLGVIVVSVGEKESEE